MRNPSVHKLLGMSNDFGLSNLLSSDSRGEKMILPTEVPNLSVLTAGPVPPNPVDLLMGPKLLLLLNVTATLGIDYVIVDAPPLLGIADSIVLGNQLQNILFVVQASRTRKSHIKSALRRLRLAGLMPRGVVLTQTLRGAHAAGLRVVLRLWPSRGRAHGHSPAEPRGLKHSPRPVMQSTADASGPLQPTASRCLARLRPVARQVPRRPAAAGAAVRFGPGNPAARGRPGPEAEPADERRNRRHCARRPVFSPAPPCSIPAPTTTPCWGWSATSTSRS